MNIEKAIATPGFMAEIELEYIAHLAQRSKAIVEIGSWSGRSACAFAQNTLGTVHCVDTWADNAYGSAPAEQTCHPEWLWTAFNRNTADYKNIHPLRMNSVEGAAWARTAGIMFDCIFVDAGHNYEDVISDILAWQPLLVPDGILCGHDYAEYHPGVMQAVRELVPKYRVVGTIWTTEKM